MSALRSRSSCSRRSRLSAVRRNAARAEAPRIATMSPSKKKPITSSPLALREMAKPAGGVKYAARSVVPMVASSAGPNPARTALAATGIVRNRSGPGAPNGGIANFSPAMASVKRMARPYRTGPGQSCRKSRRDRSRSRSCVASTPEGPPARNLPTPYPTKQAGSFARGTGCGVLAEPSTAEEADDRSHHDSLEDLIARVDREKPRRLAGKEHLREERGRNESEPRVEPDERAAGAGGPAGLVDEPVDRDGFDECRECGKRVQRASRPAVTHASPRERHPRLPEDGAVPEEADDHCGDGRDDDRYPVHVSLLQRACVRKAKARAQASRPRGRRRHTPDRIARGA